MLFKTEWCPHCKKSMPEWITFETYINKIKDDLDYNITTLIIDCDEQESIAEKYKIEGYPTIKLIYKGEIYDYDAKPDKYNLIEFIESSTNTKLPNLNYTI